LHAIASLSGEPTCSAAMESANVSKSEACARTSCEGLSRVTNTAKVQLDSVFIIDLTLLVNVSR
jgi:hypothetical protein